MKSFLIEVNMINYFYGDLFSLVEDMICDGNHMHFIIHGCNAQGRMGTGFAKTLRDKYPGAYDEYRNEYLSNNNRLKVGSVVNYTHSPNLIISNAITQDFYGYDGEKYVSYDAIDSVFEELDGIAKVLKTMGGYEEIHFHFPKLGAALGGGDWDVIESIIEHRVQNAQKYLYELK